jgi:hypothetical protein
MTSRSRFFLVSMCVAFVLCILGLLVGMTYDLFLVFARHRTLESVLGISIPFYKSLGAIGILGFLFFLAFLVSLVSGNHKGADPK